MRVWLQRAGSVLHADARSTQTDPEIDMKAAPVLEGIRVLDASRILAGPYCGQLLADTGAEVIKCEGPEGDQNRYWPPLVDGQGTNYLCVNRGKEGIVIDLSLPQGRALLHDLVRKSDVCIQNFLPRVASKLEVDYDTLSAINPDLIYVNISGYGVAGPLREKPGYDMMVNAYCGIMGLTGEPDRAPVRVGVPSLDMTTGILAYGAVTTALLARALGKARGQRIDLSLLETGIALLGYRAVNWLCADYLEDREGSRYMHLTPYGAFRCRDGEMMIGVPNDRDWQKLCAVLGDAVLESPRYATNAQRCALVDELTLVLEQCLSTRSVPQVLELLTSAGISCAPINNVAQVLAEEQVRANDMVLPAAKRDGSTMSLLGVPFKFSETPAAPGKAPPRLGEDTDAVLQRLLNLPAQTLERLRAEGVI